MLQVFNAPKLEHLQTSAKLTALLNQIVLTRLLTWFPVHALLTLSSLLLVCPAQSCESLKALSWQRSAVEEAFASFSRELRFNFADVRAFV